MFGGNKCWIGGLLVVLAVRVPDWMSSHHSFSLKIEMMTWNEID